MKPDKQTQDSSLKRVKATSGYTLPIFYKGSIIFISEMDVVEIDMKFLRFEPRIQFEAALADKQILEVGV